jgi:hypothetical protein
MILKKKKKQKKKKKKKSRQTISCPYRKSTNDFSVIFPKAYSLHRLNILASVFK